MAPPLLKDKVPPHNTEAEQAVLGALLLDGNAVSKVAPVLHPDTFYSKRHSLIYEAIISLYSGGEPVDTITLKDKLISLGKLEEAGGVVYLSGLTDTVPTSANVDYYANMVLDASIRRELIKLSSEVIAESHDETKESRQVLEAAQKKILGMSGLGQGQEILPMTVTVKHTFDIISERMQNHNAYTGIPSGITDLDNLTGGFQNSELIIIGARPSVGKTALALTMIQHIAIEKKIPAAFFSLEMPHQHIGMRLLAQVAKLDSARLRTGLLTQRDFVELQRAAGDCYEAPLFIMDSPTAKILDLGALARRLVFESGIKIIFIDYISLITSDDSSKERHLQVAEFSRSLKGLARELNIPVVALSQLNRDTEKTRHKPTLADIRESGSIEQDADVVLFIHRDKEKQAEDKSRSLDTELILAKQRNGPIGSVFVRFFPTYTKFENAAPGDAQGEGY
ncbi:MAG: replicative DNA helicase [Spirochaetaceae bacterium]|jgi:replicative DNA helicase|nr:replicative DNA helicase [Spirochaetaceae bacterium]